LCAWDFWFVPIVPAPIVTNPCTLLPSQYSSQVCRAGLLCLWTRECEQGIVELRYDRKALHQAGKRFGAVCARLAAASAKGSFRNMESAVMSHLHRLRLEGMVAVCYFPLIPHYAR
jgi:dynein heavy chain